MLVSPEIAPPINRSKVLDSMTIVDANVRSMRPPFEVVLHCVNVECEISRLASFKALIADPY